LAPTPSYQLDCDIVDIDDDDGDGSDDAVPVFVKHTEAMLDEIDKIVSIYINSSQFSFFGTTS